MEKEILNVKQLLCYLNELSKMIMHRYSIEIAGYLSTGPEPSIVSQSDEK